MSALGLARRRRRRSGRPQLHVGYAHRNVHAPLRLYGHRLQGDRAVRAADQEVAPLRRRPCRRRSAPHRFPPAPPGAVWSAQKRPRSAGRRTWRRCRGQAYRRCPHKPRSTAGRARMAAYQRQTHGRSSRFCFAILWIRTHGKHAMSAIEPGNRCLAVPFTTCHLSAPPSSNVNAAANFGRNRAGRTDALHVPVICPAATAEHVDMGETAQ